MKNSKLNLVRIAVVAVLCLFSLAASSVAATHPLNYPYGLAVDAKGNLYVANTSSSEILVYSPTHAQLASKTITADVSLPTSVAFDPNGNLWVANNGAPVSLTEYSPAGVQNTRDTITNGITSPDAIAIDGLDNIWVEDNFTNLVVYAQSQTSPLLSIPAALPITGLAAHQGYLAIGANSYTFIGEISLFLHNDDAAGQFPTTCFGMAYDKAGYLYCGNQDDTLTVTDPAGNVKTLATLASFPTGLAIDNARKLVYVSSGPANTISVYTTGGTLLTTIK
ncbi:MAG: hypothetical protein ACRD3Q_02385 [Terriglobales bacterium]